MSDHAALVAVAEFDEIAEPIGLVKVADAFA